MQSPVASHSPYTVVSLSLETVSKQFAQHEMTIRALESENQALRRHNQYLQEQVEILLAQNQELITNKSGKLEDDLQKSDDNQNSDSQIILMNNANRIIAALSNMCTMYESQSNAPVNPPLSSGMTGQQQETVSLPFVNVQPNVSNPPPSAAVKHDIPQPDNSVKTAIQSFNNFSTIEGDMLSSVPPQNCILSLTNTMTTKILETLKIHSRNITNVLWLDNNFSRICMNQKNLKINAILNAMELQNFFISTSKDCTARIWSVPTSVLTANIPKNDNKRDDPTAAPIRIVGIDAKCYRADSPITAVCVVQANALQLKKSLEKMIQNPSLSKTFLTLPIGNFLVNSTSFVVLGDAAGNVYVHVSPLTLLFSEGGGGLRHRPCSDLTTSQVQFTNDKIEADGSEQSFKCCLGTQTDPVIIWSILDVTVKENITENPEIEETNSKIPDLPVASFACITSNGVIQVFDICNSTKTSMLKVLICEDKDTNQQDFNDYNENTFPIASNVVEAHMARVSAAQIIKPTKSIPLYEPAELTPKEKVHINMTVAKSLSQFIVAGLRERLWDKDSRILPISFTPIEQSDLANIAKRTGPRLIIVNTADSNNKHQNIIGLNAPEAALLAKNSLGIAPINIFGLEFYYKVENQAGLTNVASTSEIPEYVIATTCSSAFPILYSIIETNDNDYSFSLLKRPTYTYNDKPYDFFSNGGISCMTICHNYLIAAKNANIFENPVIAIFAIEVEESSKTLNLKIIKEQSIGSVYGTITSISATTVNKNNNIIIAMGGVEGSLVITTEQ